MEFAGNKYFTTKNTIIKYERFLLKVRTKAQPSRLVDTQRHALLLDCVSYVQFSSVLGAWILRPCTTPSQSEWVLTIDSIHTVGSQLV